MPKDGEADVENEELKNEEQQSEEQVGFHCRPVIVAWQCRAVSFLMFSLMSRQVELSGI